MVVPTNAEQWWQEATECLEDIKGYINDMPVNAIINHKLF